MQLKTVGLGLSLFLLTLPLMNSCSKNADTFASNQNEPVGIVSVTGPMPPFNPGGPEVEITLKNISNESIYSLTATLTLENQLTGSAFGIYPAPFNFDFGITHSNLLLPGQTTSATLVLIGGGLEGGTSYPLIINAGFINDAGQALSTSYTKQVQVTAPPAPYTFTSDDQTSTSVIALNGLGLTLSMSSTAYKPGDKVSITVDERNTLWVENNVLRADSWAFQGLTLGPCGTLGFPFGVSILQGNYDATNVASVTPLQSLYDPNGIYSCPAPPDFVSYDFQPSSDVASLVPTNPSNYEAVPSSMTYAVTSAGFWTGSPNATFSDFTPGIYTVVGGDEWGVIALLHFTVS